MLFAAVDPFSVNLKIREQASCAREGLKLLGRTLLELMPSLKQAIARSIDSTLRSLRKTSNSAEKVISWIKQLMVISVHSQSLALPWGNVWIFNIIQLIGKKV